MRARAAKRVPVDLREDRAELHAQLALEQQVAVLVLGLLELGDEGDDLQVEQRGL